MVDRNGNWINGIEDRLRADQQAEKYTQTSTINSSVSPVTTTVQDNKTKDLQDALKSIQLQLQELQRKQDLKFSGYDSRIEDFTTQNEVKTGNLNSLLHEFLKQTALQNKQWKEERQQLVEVLKTVAGQKRKRGSSWDDYDDSDEDDRSSYSDYYDSDEDDRHQSRKKRRKADVYSKPRDTTRSKDKEEREYREYRRNKRNNEQAKDMLDLFQKSLQNANAVGDENVHLAHGVADKIGDLRKLDD
ncbi:unnamed protein product [Ambrosiozyma monospora]|uniref:Unnamed protein product n=1 Tax=Ambrosiozyma monospora TaxID=43982 RepID=A0ACB5T1S6_AMBMO|nr:unnamed protein product [Ambrosiozyma monospora]